MSFKLDSKGIAEILNSDEIAQAVNAAANAIAGNVSTGHPEIDATVTVRAYTTDRRAAAVSIAHPAGLALEAKRGVLNRAASSVGLTIKSKT